MTTTDEIMVRETFESRELYAKAEAHIRRNNYGKAVHLLREAMKIAPDNPRYASALGLCIAMQGEHAEGEKICRDAIASAGQDLDPVLLVNLGRICLKRGDRHNAREYLLKAYQLDPTHPATALELSSMGVRRKPVLPFLGRNHPINVRLGKLRYQLRERRHKGLKK
ncbi:MAG: tetratricopeptide repeat protein [Candidatus Krumholzibacteria bacterium]|nr:tetratricopeptide repeat protein [Candidatus Krumholzibacteria bacterium]